ncbi:MAG: energy transducer TonB [Bacteroides sp.]|nr:energy transducer TonB [Bacteroides sp.]
MMLKERSNPWARLKYLYVLPAAAITLTAFARPELSSTMEEISAVKVSNLSAIAEVKNTETPVPEEQKIVINHDSVPQREVFTVVEKLPEFPGGPQALIAYLSRNIKYPASAQQAGDQGMVVVQFTVEADGSITSPKIRRGISPALDQEAIRIVEGMPDWIPGEHKGEKVAVFFTLPIQFSLTSPGSDNPAAEETQSPSGPNQMETVKVVGYGN